MRNLRGVTITSILKDQYKQAEDNHANRDKEPSSDPSYR